MMAIAPHWHALAQLFAERMLNSIAEGIAIALFGWILLRALGRQNSSTRFAVWFSALAVIAALPFCESLTASAAASPALATHSALRLPAAWAIDLFLLWALVAGTGLARIAFGFWQLRKLRRSCVAIESGNLHPLLRESLQKFGLNKLSMKNFGSVRQLEVCTSDRVRVPTAIGFLHPAIVIPSWALRELSPVELNATTGQIWRSGSCARSCSFIPRSGGSGTACLSSARWPATTSCLPRTPTRAPTPNAWSRSPRRVSCGAACPWPRPRSEECSRPLSGSRAFSMRTARARPESGSQPLLWSRHFPQSV